MKCNLKNSNWQFFNSWHEFNLENALRDIHDRQNYFENHEPYCPHLRTFKFRDLNFVAFCQPSKMKLILLKLL